MKKKVLKIIGIVFLVVLGLLIAAPFFLEAKIGEIIRNNVNNNINGRFGFSKADLSLLGSFPNAEVGIENVYLVNAAPFEGDTLFSAKEVSLKMGIGQLFKGADDPIQIKSLIIDGANLNIVVDEEENANYNIAKESETDTEVSADEDGFTFDLQSYEITDSNISYTDLATAIQLKVLEIEHNGKGDLSLNESELETVTSALVSFGMDSVNYLNKNKVKLDALIGIDLAENKYSFLKNEALVNQLPLVFDGFVKVNEENQEVDISFETPSSDFKNFLAVIPEEYSKNIENVETTGDFVVSGKFNGVVDEQHILKFNIKINSDNASFKYPDLPKAVRNIYIDTEINNTTGISEDTYVNVKKASFMIDEDNFNLVSRITDLLGNTKVDAHIDGNMNLANISKAYPLPADLNLKGLLKADVTTAFDMASVEKKQYEKTKTTGNIDVKNFEYKSAEFRNPLTINTLAMDFTPTTVNLRELQGKTGKTDFNATGSIGNLLGFMFNEESVKGNFNLQSDVFAVDDFMDGESVTDGDDKEEKDSSEPTPKTERISIPAFLDANINASANTVLYDNITLKNVKGNLRIKDEKASLSNMTSSIFDGNIAFNGEVSTKGEKSTFAMNMDMKELQIGETFKALELFKALAPIAKIMKGQINTDISLSGNLTDELTPDLFSLTGNVLADVFAREINAEEAPLLSALDGKLDFINLQELNLKNLKTKLSFENGLVQVKPFAINYKDIAINIDGNHTFDQKLNYKATMEVPAKYLGTEVNNLIAKIDEKELENLTIPVVASIGGNYTSPQVTTDLKSGVQSLTSKLVEIQKQKLLNQGKDKAKDLIGGILSGNKGGNDSIAKKDSTKVGVKDVLGGVLGKNTQKDSVKVDSSATEKDPLKEKAKDVLGGLFGKKKKDSVKKDSVK